MPVTLSKVLSSAERIVLTIEARLNNTAVSEWGFEDQNCGFVTNCGLDLSIVVNNNSAIVVTAGQAKNSGGSDVVQEGVQLRRNLADPFSGGADQSIGKLKLSFLESGDALHTRDWDNRQLTIKSGGVVEGDEMLFSDYPLMFAGVSNGHDHNEQSMLVSLSLASKELTNVFPKDTYTSGEAKGEVIPHLFGAVRNYKPVELGGGLYQYQAVQQPTFTVGEISAAYDNGTALTQDVAGSINQAAFDAATPITGEYVYYDGFIKTNATDEILLTVDHVNIGMTGVREIIDVVNKIVEIGCDGRVPVTWDGVEATEEIGWVFDKQRTVREHLNELLTPLDLYFTENATDNGITIRRRYNGQALDFNGNLNVRDSFYFDEADVLQGSLSRVRTEPRPQTTRVLYDKNWHVIEGEGVPTSTRVQMKKEYEKTSAVLSPKGSAPPIDIKSPLVLEADAIAFSIQTAARDGARNQRYSLTVHGIGHELEVGYVGTIVHPLMPTNSFSEIRQVTESTSSRKTNLTVIVYE